MTFSESFSPICYASNLPQRILLAPILHHPFCDYSHICTLHHNHTYRLSSHKRTLNRPQRILVIMKSAGSEYPSRKSSFESLAGSSGQVYFSVKSSRYNPLEQCGQMYSPSDIKGFCVEVKKIFFN